MTRATNPNNSDSELTSAKPYRGRGRPRKKEKALTVEEVKQKLIELRAKVGKRKKRAWGAYEDIIVDDARIEELAKQGPVLDGHIETSYQKMSPPILPHVREWLESPSFDHVDLPASPGLYLLWDQGRVVYVGKSAYGLMSHRLSDNLHGGASTSYEAKIFDRLSFIPIEEDMCDICTRALVRLLRPKYNRVEKMHPLGALDRAALEAMGFPTP